MKTNRNHSQDKHGSSPWLKVNPDCCEAWSVDVEKDKREKVVSKKSAVHGKKAYKKISGWTTAFRH